MDTDVSSESTSFVPSERYRRHQGCSASATTSQCRRVSNTQRLNRGSETQIQPRIGAGTGLFTRAFLKHPDFADAVKEIKAIEPSDGMLDVFNTTVNDSRVSSVKGTFDTTGVEDGWADLITIAQVSILTQAPLEHELIAERHSTGALTSTLPLPNSRASSNLEESSRSSGTWKIGKSTRFPPCSTN